jgi:alpha-glucosidase
LTLRVYPGKDCRGTVYLDDGKTFAYTRGEFLRMEFSCVLSAEGISVHIGKHQGSFRPWWNQIHLEIYGWDALAAGASLNGNANALSTTVDTSGHVMTLDIPDDAHGADLEIRKPN